MPSNYKKGKIYKLYNEHGTEYIGHTCSSLSTEKRRLDREYSMYVKCPDIVRKRSCFFVYEDCEPEDVRIELIEDYPCTSANLLVCRKDELVDKHKHVNNLTDKSFISRYYTCDTCDCAVMKKHRSRHETTKKHINNLEDGLNK